MKNILLYLSAFVPMYALILIKQVIELLVGNIKLNFLDIFVIILLMTVIILGFIGLKLEMTRKKQTVKVIRVIEKTNTTDEHFLGYFSLFVLFSITFDLSKISMLVVFILIIIMIGIVYVKNKLFYINPLLNLLGFNFYDIVYKTDSEQLKQTTKIFFKGDLLLNKKYYIEVKDENFSFLEKLNK
ncbi:MAG: hypothetical protein IJA23_05490 [Clostridia bacterium]|nr:hypothetical protein [Clostridia bacterium]